MPSSWLYRRWLSADDGFYVSVVMLLTSMKFIIALLPQEVKRYVVISLILFRKMLILKNNIAQFPTFSVSLMAFFSLVFTTLMPHYHACGRRADRASNR